MIFENIALHKSRAYHKPTIGLDTASRLFFEDWDLRWKILTELDIVSFNNYT